MSRSYKKTPIYKDHSPKGKKLAARKIRRLSIEEIPNGNSYKKFYNSYNVSDYSFNATFSDFIYWRFIRFEDREPTPEETKKLYREWFKQYKAK